MANSPLDPRRGLGAGVEFTAPKKSPSFDVDGYRSELSVRIHPGSVSFVVQAFLIGFVDINTRTLMC